MNPHQYHPTNFQRPKVSREVKKVVTYQHHDPNGPEKLSVPTGVRTYAEMNKDQVYPYTLQSNPEIAASLQLDGQLQDCHTDSFGNPYPGVGYYEGHFTFTGPPGYPTFMYPTASVYPGIGNL